MTRTVSQKTEDALRAAMMRLLEGTSVHTDGCLTVANLAREAGVSRATANRATAVLAEFRAAEARFRSGSVAGLKERIRELEAELRTLDASWPAPESQPDTAGDNVILLPNRSQELKSGT